MSSGRDLDIMISISHHDGMKRRFQIQLDPEDYQALKAWASAYGISMSAAVRMLIRERLVDEGARHEAVARFLCAAGSVPERDDEREVSREHDRYLYAEPE